MTPENTTSKEVLKGLPTTSSVEVLNLSPEEVKEHFVEVKEIHSWMRAFDEHVVAIPQMRDMLMTVANSQATMARSAESMSDTFKMAEERYAKMEVRYENLAQALGGKDQIPLRSHYATLAAALIPVFVIAVAAIFGVLYFTKYDIKASLSEIELNQGRTQDLIESQQDETHELLKEQKNGQ